MLRRPRRCDELSTGPQRPGLILDQAGLMTTIPRASAGGAVRSDTAPQGARAFTPNDTAASVHHPVDPDTDPSPNARGAAASDASAPGVTIPDVLLALSRLGHFTRAQALGAGVTDSQLRRWGQAGVLTRLGQGLYAVQPAPGMAGGVTRTDGPDDPWQAAREDHLRRAVALLEAIPGSYLTGVTAALAHQLPVLTMPTTVEMSRRPYGPSTRPGLAMRRPWGAGPADVPLAGIARPVQGLAQVGIDIAAHHGIPDGLVVADAARRLGLDADALVAAADAFGTRAGAHQARTVARFADPRTESAAESRARWVLATLGYTVIPQFEVYDAHGRFVARADFLVAGTNVIVEVDGLLKYTDREALRREKLREVALQRLGYHVVRVLYRDLDHHERVRSLVREAVALAARAS